TQNYISTQNSGNDWSSPQRMLTDIQGCATNINFFTNPDGLIFMYFVLNDQVYLMAWNGEKWSKAEVQTTLSTSVNPDTFTALDFRTGPVVNSPDNVLYAAGADSGEESDVWFTQRNLGSVDDWLPAETPWLKPTSVLNSETSISANAMTADQYGQLHVFWSEAGGTGDGLAIHYSQWDGKRWTSPADVVSEPNGMVGALKAISQKDKIYLVWNDPTTGKISFSMVPANLAVNAESWSQPVVLPGTQSASISPDIALDENGTIYVTYATPVNQGRGIYLTSSMDDGITWNAPVQVFDAEAANWIMVNEPKLAVGEGGKMFLLWARYQVPPESRPLELYYSYSSDYGAAWSAPEAITNNPAYWSQVVVAGDGAVHRAWEEMEAGVYTVWHQASQDGGKTWSNPTPFENFSQSLEPTDLVLDTQGEVHMLQVRNMEQRGYVLQHWLWNGRLWSVVDFVDLDLQPDTSQMLSLIGTAANGHLAALYNVLTPDKDTNADRDILYLTERIEPADVVMQPTQVVASIQGDVSPLGNTPVSVAATPTTTFPVTGNASSPITNWTGLIIGVILAAVSVVVFIIVGVRMAGRKP
ncbi:MAG: sialidase family protein, partial [Anaerolineaceae bacterium]|nr:sialidase family protein [Anaerolineaceae bacterium]